MIKLFNIALALHLFVFFQCPAQERKLEISTKASFIGTLAGDDGTLKDKQTYAIGFGLESVYFVTPAIGVGAFFYEYSGNGETTGYYQGSPNNSDVTFNTTGRSFGLSLQATTNKNRKFRIYFSGKFTALQLRDESESGGFSIYNDGYVISGGLGIMLKITRFLNFNLFEASYMIPSKKLSYSDEASTSGVMVSSGLTFKFIKAK